MGARITLCDPHRLLVEGSGRLKGISLESPDIRAGMALIVAGLCAERTTVIEHGEVAQRGYERVAERLRGVGADVVEEQTSRWRPAEPSRGFEGSSSGGDLATFRRFLALVASRCGQLLNKTDLAAPLGVSVPTIGEWRWSRPRPPSAPAAGSHEVADVPKSGHDDIEPTEGEKIDAIRFVARVLVQIPDPRHACGRIPTVSRTRDLGRSLSPAKGRSRSCNATGGSGSPCSSSSAPGPPSVTPKRRFARA